MEKAKNDGRKKLWDQRTAQGLCVYCGVNPKRPAQLGCNECALKHSKRQSNFSTKRKDRTALYRRKIRQKAIEKYGGVCNCPGCNVTELLFLTIDHINGNGSEDRKTSVGTSWYMKLIREPKRDDLQVLCYNCNNGREICGGVCPHLKPSPIDLNNVTDLRSLRRLNVGVKFNWPEDEVLLSRYRDEGPTKLGREIGCSPSAIIKRLNTRGLRTPIKNEKITYEGRVSQSMSTSGSTSLCNLQRHD